MIKKIYIAVLTIFIFSINCYAEGQDGADTIITFGYYMWAFMCISLYVIIGGIIIKLILFKTKLLLKNQTLKAFSISFLITVLAAIIFGADFTFLIWHYI